MPQVLRLKDFGAVGDGVTDDIAALDALNARALALQGQGYSHFLIEAEPRHYVYSRNNWLFRIKSYELNAYGAKFQCISTNPWGIAFQSLHCGTPWQTNTDDASFPDLRDGHLFGSASAASASITLASPSDLAEYLVGGRVVLYGFALQDIGYPPNPRYFEYKTIAAIDQAAATITFTDLLAHGYDDRWVDKDPPDSTPPFGKPRILPLDRADFNWPERVILRGFELLINPNKTTDSWTLHGRNVLVEDVTCDTIFPNSSESFEVIRSKITRQVLPDKFVKQHRLDNCDILGTYGDAVTADIGIVENCRIGINATGDNNITPGAHNFILRNNVIYSSKTAKFGIVNLGISTRTDYVEVTGNTFINRSDTLKHVINNGVHTDFAIEDVIESSILFASTTNNFNLTHRKFGVNGIIWKKDGSKVGRVTEIYEHTDGRILVNALWSPAPPVAGEIWQVREVDTLVTSNNVVSEGAPVDFVRYPLHPDRTGTKRYTLNFADMPFNGVLSFPVQGFVRRIEVNVMASISTQVLKVNMDAEQFTFDLKTLGRRTVDAYDINTLTGDVVTNAWASRWTELLTMSVSGAAGLAYPSVITFTCEIEGFGF